MLKIIDPHVHMISRVTDDYVRMRRAGIAAVVEPAFWLGSPRTYPGTFFDYFEHIIGFEAKRAAQFGVRHFCCIALNPREANNRPLARAVLARMPEYLRREGVVAVGEIGFDDITPAEEYALRRQLEMAAKFRLPALIHSPHRNKAAGVEKTCRVIEDMGLDRARVLIDHNTEETIAMSRSIGVWSGHTIYPITKLTPARAARILEKYGTDRMLINSSADWGISDPLRVARTVQLLRRRGWSEVRIKKVVFDNPRAFFAQSGRFKI